LNHKRVKFEGPKRFVDLKNGYFREEWDDPEPPSRNQPWRDNRPRPATPSQVYYPVQVPVPAPMQVPIHVPVPPPMMYMAPLFPCNCPCCLNGCPGPDAHYLAYSNPRGQRDLPFFFFYYSQLIIFF
jgi:hypothetical protein